MKDAFSVKTPYLSDATINPSIVKDIYVLSRQKYNRTLIEAKEEINTQQQDVMSAIEEFAEPMI